jgi:hypothetical protein
LILSELGLDSDGESDEGILFAVEEKLDRVLESLGLEYDPTEGVPPEALVSLRDGKEVEAIYHFRKATGASLRETMGVLRGIDSGALRRALEALELEGSESPELPPSDSDEQPRTQSLSRDASPNELEDRRSC